MSFELLNKSMHWPDSKEVYSPSGAGPRILVRLAQEKIGKTLERLLGGRTKVKVGLLTKTPGAVMTAAPIAVVCEFNRHVTNEQLADTHRLAWNFSRAPLLITIEPSLIRTWSCCELPAANEQEVEQLSFQICEATLDIDDSDTLSENAAHALNWVRLASGDFYREFPNRFKRNGRADQALLNELKDVRQDLARQRLPDDTIHDLIARIIFIQFLFDRKDTEGRSALNPSLLEKLHDEGTLKKLHDDLPTILADFNEAYRFFHWLNDKFNGDLFPGKGATKTAREAEWRLEKSVVGERHLKTLADFVSGTVRVKDRQRSLWRQYSFDVIPLEFISSVYEEFVTANSAHYTPGFLVDFMLDGVLPWDGDQWDLRILDPACGSGIFLVKAYQRLIQRWRNANADEQPTPTVLRRMLERNLFGVDIDEHAVRVASFSLYLTMCDEIDPKNYLSVWRFPRMRGERLIHADFFAEGVSGFDTAESAKSYDVVIGNAPWGKDSATEKAKEWAKSPNHQWEIANKAIGTLFLAKAAELAAPDGRVSLIQPASALLFNRSGPPTRFREQFFSTFKVVEIVNLSTLRFNLFEKATSPPCIVTFVPSPPDGEPLTYISPKQVEVSPAFDLDESRYAVIIDPTDISLVSNEESIGNEFIWTALAWGGRRDFALTQKLRRFDSLNNLKHQKKLSTREGIIRGDRLKQQEDLRDRHILNAEDFPENSFLVMHASELPINDDLSTDSKASTSFTAFDAPQMLIKQSWTVEHNRFRAVLVTPDRNGQGALCSQSYISAHTDDESILMSAVLSYNSQVCVYFLLLTSGRLASYRPEPLVEELRSIPIPPRHNIALCDLDNYAEIDQLCYQSFGLKDSESILIDDLFEFTMADFKGDESSPGRQLTRRNESENRYDSREPELSQYCQLLLRVLKSVSGDEQRICATIFQDTADQRLPVRLVACYLSMERDEEITVETIDSDKLCFLLSELDDKYIQIHGKDRGGIFFQRVARVYMEQDINGVPTPVVYIVKPDRVRYWTRSAGLRDADEVAADAQHWRLANPPSYDQEEA